MLLERFLVKFLKYEILVVTPVAAALQVGTAGTAAPVSIPAIILGTILAILKASKDALEENISLKNEQKNALNK